MLQVLAYPREEPFGFGGQFLSVSPAHFRTLSRHLGLLNGSLCLRNQFGIRMLISELELEDKPRHDE